MSPSRCTQWRLLALAVAASAIFCRSLLVRPLFYFQTVVALAVVLRCALAMIVPLWVLAKWPSLRSVWFWAIFIPSCLVLTMDITLGLDESMHALFDLSSLIFSGIRYVFHPLGFVVAIPVFIALGRLEARTLGNHQGSSRKQDCVQRPNSETGRAEADVKGSSQGRITIASGAVSHVSATKCGEPSNVLTPESLPASLEETLRRVARVLQERSGAANVVGAEGGRRSG